MNYLHLALIFVLIIICFLLSGIDNYSGQGIFASTGEAMGKGDIWAWLFAILTFGWIGYAGYMFYKGSKQ